MVNAWVRPEWRKVVERASRAGDAGYAEFIARFPATLYRQRVADLGFEGLGRVLDLGCGHGLWTSALARTNYDVVALEINGSRLRAAGALASDEGLDNVRLVQADGVRLPFADASFDGVFCYGVFMFLPYRAALDEIGRVLRDRGRLYVCTNGPGWWWGLVLRHVFGNAQVRRSAWRALRNGIGGDVPSSIHLRDVARVVHPDMWDAVASAPEGHLGRSDSALAMYPPKQLGLPNVIEFAAHRRPRRGTTRDAPATDLEPAVVALLDETDARSRYEYFTPLDRLPQPRPALDLVDNCDPSRLAWARALARRQSPNAFLAELVRRHAPAELPAEERVKRLVTFAQRHFFHHFAGQPMIGPGRLLLDPVAVFAFQACRCGSAARLLVDAFLFAGFEARLVGAACHTAAEVLVGGRWLLADASLYPPGIMPRDTTGRLIDIDTLVRAPELLDVAPSYINYHHEYIEAFLARYPETAPAIGKYLDAPLLPSTAYFGREFFAGRTGGQLTRYAKRGGANDWERDASYGWESLDLAAIAQGEPRDTEQRPRQPRYIRIEGPDLVWDPSPASPGTTAIEWSAHLSSRTRGWSYQSLPAGCDFQVPGRTLRLAEPRLALREIASAERYVSIRTIVRDWDARSVFYLPSVEADIAEDARVPSTQVSAKATT